MSVRTLIEAILVHSPVEIHHIVEQYFGLFYLDEKECCIIYDSTDKCHKLLDLNTGKIGLLDNNVDPINFPIQQRVLNHIEYEYKSYEIAVISEESLPIKFFTRSRLLSHIEFLKKSVENYDFITWVEPKEKFSIVYDARKRTRQVLTKKDAICVSPGNEQYKYFPAYSDLTFALNSCEINAEKNLVYYDKSKNIILNKDRTHSAILLSMGWHAPRWATKSAANLFDVTKVLQILPGEKLSRKKLCYYEIDTPMKNLCVRWVPVGVNFVIYYSSDRGENYKLVDDFEFTA